MYAGGRAVGAGAEASAARCNGELCTLGYSTFSGSFPHRPPTSQQSGRLSLSHLADRSESFLIQGRISCAAGATSTRVVKGGCPDGVKVDISRKCPSHDPQARRDRRGNREHAHRRTGRLFRGEGGERGHKTEASAPPKLLEKTQNRLKNTQNRLKNTQNRLKIV